MRRVVILGRGASGKSMMARRLGEMTGLPVIELDKLFWRAGLAPTPREEWVQIQQQLVFREQWIMDGDLGAYDAVEVRLRAADTIIFLDFSLFRCAWRAIRRSSEDIRFWRWILAYRRRSRPVLMEAIRRHAPTAQLHVLRGPRGVARFLAALSEKLQISG